MDGWRSGKDAFMMLRRGIIDERSISRDRLYVASIGSNSNINLMRTEVMAMILVHLGISGTNRNKRRKKGMIKTHATPRAKMTVSAIFFVTGICRPQSTGMAKKKIIISMMRSVKAQAL